MKKICCLLVGLLVGSVNAAPIVIDFDDLGPGVSVDGHYSGLGVTFVDATTNSFGSLPGGSAPTAINHSTSGFVPQPSDPIEAIFSSLASSVSLTGLDVGNDGFILSAFDAVSGGNLLATEQIIGIGDGVGASSTLTVAATGIKRVEFSQVRDLPDGISDGIAFDNLSFVVDSSTPITPPSIPEPLTLGLFALGLAGIGCSRKRKAR